MSRRFLRGRDKNVESTRGPSNRGVKELGVLFVEVQSVSGSSLGAGEAPKALRVWTSSW